MENAETRTILGEQQLTELGVRKDCFCNYQFNVKACSIQGIFKTADVVKNDPSSVACPADTIDVMSITSFLFSLFRSHLLTLTSSRTDDPLPYSR